MPTSQYTTIPAFKTALVAACDARTDRQVAYAWPGEQTDAVGIFLGSVRFVNDIANIKEGRKRRDETYRLEVILNVFDPNANTTEDAEAVDLVLGELLEVLDGALADDPKMDNTVQWAVLAEGESVRLDTATGLGLRMRCEVAVRARLI